MSTLPTVTRRVFLGSAAAALAATRAAAADDLPQARVRFKDFLPQLGENDTTRRSWWTRFQKVEAFARQCVGAWAFGKLTTVNLTTEKVCLWAPSGVIRVSRESLDKASLYHEMFHPVLHNAPFKIKSEHSRIDYRLYVECLCNAFQYFMETAVGPKGDWTKRMEKWRPQSWAQIIADSGDIGYDMTYGLPALEFIKACAGFEEFKKMVGDLNAK
jgi:hypothetical protein